MLDQEQGNAFAHETQAQAAGLRQYLQRALGNALFVQWSRTVLTREHQSAHCQLWCEGEPSFYVGL